MTISATLEDTLHRMFVRARADRCESVGTEWLLLALLDDGDAAEALLACKVNLGELRDALTAFIKVNVRHVAGTDEVDTTPTLAFQRAVQRAIMNAQTSTPRREVTGASVLLAIFGEKDSDAVRFLHEQNVTRFDVINYIMHGVDKRTLRRYAWTPEEEESLLAGCGETNRAQLVAFFAAHKKEK
jgi:ATP-dependent Clp protease ATP-binding subunit ClpA